MRAGLRARLHVALDFFKKCLVLFDEHAEYQESAFPLSSPNTDASAREPASRSGLALSVRLFMPSTSKD